MFQIGESVVYGTTGVCTISAIGPLSMHGVDRKQQYYTLQPIHQEGAVYIPVDGEKLKTMRYPLTKQQAEELLARIPDIAACEIQHFNYKQRTDAFSAALHENRCESLIGIIKAVSMKKQRFREKQQYNVDNNFMKRAMNLLCGELAYVLEQPFDEMRTTVERSVHDAIQAERKARREASAAERAAEAAQAEQERTDADADEA